MKRFEPAWLLFASDADLLAMWGAACLLVAIGALAMERRRHRRDRILAADQVGWVPWTMIFLTSAMIGFALIAAAIAG